MNKQEQFVYMFVCPRCGATTMLEEDTQFCTGCGISLVAPCPRCNALVPPRYRYCQSCGMDLGEQPELIIKQRKSLRYKIGFALIIFGILFMIGVPIFILIMPYDEFTIMFIIRGIVVGIINIGVGTYLMRKGKARE